LKDDETGFYYCHARYYDPKIGKFLTTDPAFDGLDLYAYCQNNPINYCDPDGLATKEQNYANFGIKYSTDPDKYDPQKESSIRPSKISSTQETVHNVLEKTPVISNLYSGFKWATGKDSLGHLYDEPARNEAFYDFSVGTFANIATIYTSGVAMKSEGAVVGGIDKVGNFFLRNAASGQRVSQTAGNLMKAVVNIGTRMPGRERIVNNLILKGLSQSRLTSKLLKYPTAGVATGEVAGALIDNSGNPCDNPQTIPGKMAKVGKEMWNKFME